MTLVPIGYFSRTHGTKGQLILKLQSDFNSEDLKVLFVELGGSNAPYFIAEMKESNGDWIVKLEGIESIDKARGLLNRSVFIDSQFHIEEEKNEWADFELIDKKFGSLGKVISVGHNGQQVLWHLSFRGKEVILPMVVGFIEKLDEVKKIIYYNAPEGLIDVYLEASQ